MAAADPLDAEIERLRSEVAEAKSGQLQHAMYAAEAEADRDRLLAVLDPDNERAVEVAMLALGLPPTLSEAVELRDRVQRVLVALREAAS